MLGYLKTTFFKNVKRLHDQNYQELKKQCQERGTLFEDPLFPAADSSLFYSEKGYIGQVEWKRPKDLCETPHFFDDGISSLDVSQGQLGNCWFIAASSVLATEKELWTKVIPEPEEQEWDPEHPENYCGIFHFRFWRFGDWVDVVIDDFLPTINGELVYAHSHSKNEFWMALLEKAYAKIHGNYEALDGGNLSDALVDFTSGFAETIDLEKGGYRTDDDKRNELFQYMKKEFQTHSLMCAAITVTSADEMEARTEVGLVKGHAYGITNVKNVNIGDSAGLLSFFSSSTQKLPMVRLRNPWGQKEWNGAFSDGSPEWSKISASEREKLGLTFQDDGEFWMTMEDYCNHFTDMSICHLINTSWFSFGQTWCEGIHKGQWVRGAQGSPVDRAGGCINNKDTFLRNPQFRFDIEKDEDTVLLMLQQKDAREKRHEGVNNLPIGFQVFKVEENRKYRLHAFKDMITSSEYIRTRNVFLKTSLKKGRYVIFPTTFDPGQEGEFIIRVFTTTINAMKEMKKDTPSQSLFPCITYPTNVTYFVVRGAVGLDKPTGDGQDAADPYCIVKCEGKSVKTPTIKDTQNPTWDTSCIFYRRNLAEPITVEIWNRNMMMDSFLGKAQFDAPLSDPPDPSIRESGLQGKNPDDPAPPGKLIVEIMTSDDLTSI